VTCVLSTIKAVKRTVAVHITSVSASDQDCNISSRKMADSTSKLSCCQCCVNCQCGDRCHCSDTVKSTDSTSKLSCCQCCVDCQCGDHCHCIDKVKNTCIGTLIGVHCDILVCVYYL